jgi:hypothetical protein
MFTVTPDELRTIYPEFEDVPDEQVAYYIEAARDYVNEGRWGTPKAKRGVMLMAAHMMSRAGAGELEGVGNTGAILSETVGSISTTYAQPVGSSDGTTLGLTPYGEQFAMLMRTVVRTPLVT